MATASARGRRERREGDVGVAALASKSGVRERWREGQGSGMRQRRGEARGMGGGAKEGVGVAVYHGGPEAQREAVERAGACHRRPGTR